ncbi:MAG: hypothetical protein ACRELF_07125 [Gemmataceae bacterium]
MLDDDPDFTLGGRSPKGSGLSLGDGDGTGDEGADPIAEILVPLVFGFAVLLVIGLLGGAVYAVVVGGVGGTIMPLLGPFIGRSGVASRSEPW